MALMPKRVKHRKSQRGRIKGNATRGNKVVFGDFGLQCLQGGWIRAQTIEAGRIVVINTYGARGDFIFESFQTSQFHRNLLKPGWVKVKGNRSTGLLW